MASDADRVWERGWDGHNLSQLRRLARLSLAEKIRWLEEAQRVVGRLERARDDSRAGREGDRE